MTGRVDEFLKEIRENDGLKNAIVAGIVVTKRRKLAELFLVTDRAYTIFDEKNALAVAKKYVPEGLEAKIRIVKRTPDEGMIKRKIFEFISKKFPAAAAFLGEDDVEVELLSSGAHFYVNIASGEQTLFTSGKILDEVSAYLSEGYCGTFYGNVRIVEKEELGQELLDEEIELQEEDTYFELRKFPICNFRKIDGADFIPTTAVYIAEIDKAEGTFAVGGTITDIEEKKYVKHNEKTNEDVEKSRFSVSLTDGTGTLRTTYFPKKATVDKILELKTGDKIVLLGENEEYNGRSGFKTAKINYGEPPEGFTPVAKKGKPVPKFYHTVFPEPYVDYTQAGLFDSLEKPSAIKDNVFVVFDMETTGLNNNPAMGRMDKIIELGAVKIVGGELTEKFSTFVACNEKLPPQIIELTGIQDEDLVGAPEIDKVLADFCKFTDGAYLVGHNVNFDYRFLQYYGEQSGYSFEKKQYDTLTLAQDVLRGLLPNYKLNSVADYYGFTFNHHRAFDDACVTAKVFIELVKAKGKLPL